MRYKLVVRNVEIDYVVARLNCRLGYEDRKDTMKKRKGPNKKKKEFGMGNFKQRPGWEIIQLPDGSFQWIIKRGV
ncbi:hypothetical protein LCGC14_1423000 [marine sediment metagenome]|uniref:Uncharacterized protein n=1 Tax=marine sediment metagenome TaxID=412755 RepID=A0A0F9JRC3_9ZZZZ